MTYLFLNGGKILLERDRLGVIRRVDHNPLIAIFTVLLTRPFRNFFDNFFLANSEIIPSKIIFNSRIGVGRVAQALHRKARHAVKFVQITQT